MVRKERSFGVCRFAGLCAFKALGSKVEKACRSIHLEVLKPWKRHKSKRKGPTNKGKAGIASPISLGCNCLVVQGLVVSCCVFYLG